MQHTFEENPNDLRETLLAAVEEHNEDPDDSGTDSIVDTEQREANTTPDTPSSESAAPGEGSAQPDDAPTTTDTPPVVPTTPSDVPATVATEPDSKPPGTWTPAAREKWATVDPTIRAEVWKREREASRALTMSADSRKFASEFEKAVQPFLGFIAAERSTPMQAFTNMMQAGAMLRVGTPQQKVSLVASMIKQYGVDLQSLDSVLAGQAPQNNPQAMVQQLVDQQLAPFKQRISQFDEQEQRQKFEADRQIDAEINAFASDPKNEFWNDVQHLVADIMEVSARSGQALSLTDAYTRATLLHEPVRQVIEARKQRESLQQKARTATRARNTAASVTNSATVANSSPQPAKGDNIRADIEAALAAQQGR